MIYVRNIFATFSLSICIYDIKQCVLCISNGIYLNDTYIYIYIYNFDTPTVNNICSFYFKLYYMHDLFRLCIYTQYVHILILYLPLSIWCIPSNCITNLHDICRHIYIYIIHIMCRRMVYYIYICILYICVHMRS